MTEQCQEIKSHIKINDTYLMPDDETDYDNIIAETVAAGKVKRIEIDLQDGTIKENGVNGAQFEDLLKIGLAILQKLDRQLPCHENGVAIAGIKGALLRLEDRKRDRETRKVEGTSAA